MVDVRSIFKDMVRQRRVQAFAVLVAIAGAALWLTGIELGMYLAAGAVILFTVATLRWIEDEELVEEEQLHQKNARDPACGSEPKASDH